MPTVSRLAFQSIFVGALLLGAGCGQTSSVVDSSRHALMIGETEVAIVVHETGREGLTLINVHENEQTSIDAALEHVRESGGRVIHLEHSGERNIRFELNDSTFVVDPNRIYTDEGIRHTLSSLSEYSPAAHGAVRTFSDSLLAILSLDDLEEVVTIHNNTDGNYSVLSYTEGGAYEADAARVHVAGEQDVDDFFFITEEAWFGPIAEAGYNVILQDNERVTDDGSLSVLCGYRGIPYVNVEAQHGHHDEQVEMLALLRSLLM